MNIERFKTLAEAKAYVRVKKLSHAEILYLGMEYYVVWKD